MATDERCANGDLVSSSSYDTMVHLPFEVLVHIFEYLALPDRIVASQVCHIWNEASRDLKFINKEIVCLHDTLYRPLQVFANSNYRIFHLLFKEVELSGSRVEAFLKKYCPYLRSLSIDNCDISSTRFVDILKLCSSLESLRVIGCRELLISGHLLDTSADIELLKTTLVNLKELDLETNRYLTDSLFNRFVSIAPNLEVLSLSGCQISFHSGLYKKFYPSHSSQSGTVVASESVLTFHNILQYITSQANKIKILRFGTTLLDNTALHNLAKVPKLQLKTLEVQACNQLSNIGIVSFIQHQHSVKRLDLSACSRIVDPSVLVICKSVAGLTSLNLARCRAITNASVAELRHLKHLAELDLSHCESVNSEGIEAGLCTWVNSAFRRLSLTALTLDENTVCRLTDSLPSLIHLDLCWCFNSVTDKSIQSVCRNLIFLKCLKLAACDKLTDAGLTGMGMGGISKEQDRSVPPVEVKTNDISHTQRDFAPSVLLTSNQMNNISLRSRAEQDIVNDAKRKEMVSQMCEDQYLKLTGSGYSLSSLQGLQVLDLTGCNRITDVGLKYAFHFRGLRELNISQCQQISQEGLVCLAINNPSIETLVMSQCFNITDDVVSNIAKSLLRLKSLDLQNCHQLTDQSLLAIGRHSVSLQHLNVSQCHGMSLEEAEYLEQHIPSLRTVNHDGLALKWQPLESPKKPVKSAPKPPPLLRFLMKRSS